MVYDFGLLIKKLREEKRWSQQQLANKLEVTKSTISAYERNLKMPSAKILKSLAIVFHVSADYLLGLEKPSNVHMDDLTTEQKQMMELLSNEFRRLNR